MAKAPRQVARAKENMENTIRELHTGPWHTELLKERTPGSLIPLVQSAKDLNKLQRYLSGHRMVKHAKLTQILSCVMCSKQSSSLTKAVHGTAWRFMALLESKCSADTL